MQTNLSQSIDITENKAKYDESVKELFADKQVLAWILKYTLEEDSINRIRFVQEIVYGKEMNLTNIDKVQGIIIRLRSNENVEKSKNVLIAMLEELLRKEDAEKKKRMLSDDYGLVMDAEMERRVNSMCNLSEVLIEKGREQGREEGRVTGELAKLISMICKKKAKGIAAKDTADMLEEEEEVVYRVYEIAENYAPDYDIEAICEEFRKVYC